jgi:hypothetical protein
MPKPWPLLKRLCTLPLVVSTASPLQEACHDSVFRVSFLLDVPGPHLTWLLHCYSCNYVARACLFYLTSPEQSLGGLALCSIPGALHSA